MHRDFDLERRTLWNDLRWIARRFRNRFLPSALCYVGIHAWGYWERPYPDYTANRDADEWSQNRVCNRACGICRSRRFADRREIDRWREFARVAREATEAGRQARK